MILNVYKQKNWTSFDVVAKVRNILRKELGRKIKVGHAGTLDPLAEGVLILLTGSDTKKQQKFMNMEKEYVCEISFGIESPTYDLEGELSYREIPNDLDIKKKLLDYLPNYVGEIDQKVPPFSAVKIKGKRLYKRARKGKIDCDNLPVKKVNVYDIKLLGFYNLKDYPTAKLKVVCGKGTYIRSLANDLGKDLGVGGVLASLVRTRIGNYTIEDSIALGFLENNISKFRNE